MSGLFYGLEIAKSGLRASQTAINIIGHNIANADTRGYTRQRVATASIEPGSMTARLAPLANAAVGGGVTIQRVDQIRNAFLDRQYRQEHAELGKWQTLTEQTGYIDSLLNELNDTGINRALAAFSGSLSTLSQDPAGSEARTAVQQSAINLASSLNHYHRRLVDMQLTQNENVLATVDQVNGLLANIAAYNKQIHTQEMGGAVANDLRDKRNLLLDELSGLIDIEYTQDSDGLLTLSSQGYTLVSHTQVTGLTATADHEGAVSGEPGMYSIYQEGTAIAYQPGGGTLAAYLELRDGAGVDSPGIPRILSNLDTLAQSLAQEMNALNTSGYTLPQGGDPSQTGVLFFDVPGGDYANITAGNFSLSAALLDSPGNIACSDQPVDPSSDNDQRGNNLRVLEMVELFDRTDLPQVGSFEGFLKGVVVEVAMKAANCKTLYGGQLSVSANLETRRQSVSSVSVDEEIVSMIKMQHAYQAAARVITAVDEALDVVINGMGRVGR